MCIPHNLRNKNVVHPLVAFCFGAVGPRARHDPPIAPIIADLMRGSCEQSWTRHVAIQRLQRGQVTYVSKESGLRCCDESAVGGIGHGHRLLWCGSIGVCSNH